MTERTTIAVAGIATTGQDRVDGPAVLAAIRATTGPIALSFAGIPSVTPTFVNEAMVPLLDDTSIADLRARIALVDCTRQIADTVRHCMEHGVRWNAGEFANINRPSIA